MTQPYELKPCPFKAANDPEKHDLVHELFDDLIFTKTKNGHAWVPKEQIRIRCTSCFTLGPPAETHSEANKLWNTRTPDLSQDQLIADVKRLRAALDIYAKRKNFIETESICGGTFKVIDWGEAAKEALAATDRPEYKEVE